MQAQTATHAAETDQTRTCADCGQAFVWTVGEQRFYREKGLTNPPKRCAACRSSRKREHRER